MKTYRSDVIKCLIWDLQEILERHTNRSSIICSYLEHFPVSALKIFPQKIYDIFSCAALKKCIIFSQKNFSNFQETELFYISGKYIQNPGLFRTRKIFRTQDILRTLSNVYDGIFCKNSHLVHFSAQIRKIKKIQHKKILYFLKRKLFLSFRKRSPPRPPRLFHPAPPQKKSYLKESFPYILENGNPDLLFRK